LCFKTYIGGIGGGKGWTVLEMKATILKPNGGHEE
jgi:hypothetical protein